MKNNSFYKKYFDLTHLIQNEFDRNIEKHGDKIKCSKGCSRCCSQIFRITSSDEFVIQKYLNELPENEKKFLKEKAEIYIDLLSSEDSDKEDFFLKPILPCPALNDSGECTIYEARPVICRRFGPPLYNYKNPLKLFACELNFEDGEEIIDEELIPEQTKIGILWDELKTEFNSLSSKKNIASTTIAEAILNS